ncbi:MAG: DUF2235 domain-containing protein [Hyphomonadaceae bacterium]
MKRIVICMDGTWQSLNQDDLTNIGVIARAVAHKETRPDGSFVHQTVIYAQGVGSFTGALTKRTLLQEASYRFTRLTGGALGEGLEDGVLDTYLRLAFDYEEGDEIFIFGFSRGAFAARRLSGLINTAGIVSRRYTHMARDGFRLYYDKPRDGAPPEKIAEHDRAARQFRMLYGKGGRNEDGTRRQSDGVPPIKFLGVFDTVAQRGIGDIIASFTPWGSGHRFKFKNYRVSPNVENARHAVALDENRVGFPVRLWDGIEEDNAKLGRRAYAQRWFIGTHGDIGGGGGSEISALALKWMCEGARDAGLRFYNTYGDDKSPLDEKLAEVGLCFDRKISRMSFWKAIQPINYPWRTRKLWTKRERPSPQDLDAHLDPSVMLRVRADYVRPRYLPSPLRPFRKALKEWQPPA